MMTLLACLYEDLGLKNLWLESNCFNSHLSGFPAVAASAQAPFFFILVRLLALFSPVP